MQMSIGLNDEQNMECPKFFISEVEDFGEGSFQLKFPEGILWWEDFKPGSGAWLVAKLLISDDAFDLVGERLGYMTSMIVIEVDEVKALQYIESHVSRHQTFKPDLETWTMLQHKSSNRPCPLCNTTMRVEPDAEEAFCEVCQQKVSIPLTM